MFKTNNHQKCVPTSVIKWENYFEG